MEASQGAARNGEKSILICYDESALFGVLKRRSKPEISFPSSFRFAAEGCGEEPQKMARKFLCLPARACERGWGAFQRNRSVRFSFEFPRAPRVRSGFAQRLRFLHHNLKPIIYRLQILIYFVRSKPKVRRTRSLRPITKLS